MDPDGSYQIIIIVLLIFLSALLTTAQTAFQLLNKYRLRDLVSKVNSRAVLVDKLLDNPTRLFDTILLTDNLVCTSAVALGSYLAIDRWGYGQGLFFTVIIMVPIIVVFAKLVPQRIARQHPEQTSIALIGSLHVIIMVFSPLSRLLAFFSVLIARILGVMDTPQEDIIGEEDELEEEIISLMAAGEEEGLIQQEEKTMIHGVFDFTDQIVRDVMVPRPDIVAVEKGITFEELLMIFNEEKFSRFPVYDTNIDNILGIVHIKDLILPALKDRKVFSLEHHLREPLFVPETKKVNELFRAMQKEKGHMAIVLDEYGSTAGLVTLEDLVEEIMGDIQDEHDLEEPEIKVIDDETVEVNAALRIEELNDNLKLEFVCDEAETIGGFVFTKLDRLPEVGDTLLAEDVEITVLEMDGHRLEKLQLRMKTG